LWRGGGGWRDVQVLRGSSPSMERQIRQTGEEGAWGIGVFGQVGKNPKTTSGSGQKIPGGQKAQVLKIK